MTGTEILWFKLNLQLERVIFNTNSSPSSHARAAWPKRHYYFFLIATHSKNDSEMWKKLFTSL